MCDTGPSRSSSSIKQTKKHQKTHECTIILIDVGVGMKQTIGTQPAIEFAIETAEWIITRKIFSESPDEFVLVLFDNDENVRFCEKEMQRPQMDWIRWLRNEVKVKENIQSNFLTALATSLEHMRHHLAHNKQSKITARNILLISNLVNHDSNMDVMSADVIINGMKLLQINLTVIGPSISSEDTFKSKKPFNSDRSVGFKVENLLETRVCENLLSKIATAINGVIYSFSEALPMLQRFLPRETGTRTQRFYFQLSKEVNMPLLLIKKIQPAVFNFNAGKFAAVSGTEVKRETIYEKTKQINNPSKPDVYDGSVSEARILSKNEVVKGYKFGETVVPYSDEDHFEYGWKHGCRCMKLIHFVKRSEMLQHYFMDGGCFYCIPPSDDRDGCIGISALVKAMIAEETVALVRFVYSVASFLKIMALFPKISKKGTHFFVAIQMPFNEDFRGQEFPLLDAANSLPTDVQLKTIKDIISAMDLSKAQFNSETGQFEEILRSRDVSNPKLQNVCQAIKDRALNPSASMSGFKPSILGDLLEPNVGLLKRASEPLKFLKENITLVELPENKKRKKNTIQDEEDEDDQKLGYTFTAVMSKLEICSLAKKLHLSDDEISSVPHLFKEKSKLSIVGSSTESSLKFKLRCEARQRMLKAEIVSLPTDEQVEICYIDLQTNASQLSSDNDKYINYSNFKKVMQSSPDAIKNFLSAKVFAELLKFDKTIPYGSVSVDKIMEFIRIKKNKLCKLIVMQYYDTAGKGYLTIEDLMEYLAEEVVPQIPALAFLDDGSLLRLYLCVATRKFAFFLDPMHHNKFRIVDVIASRLLEEMECVNNAFEAINDVETESSDQDEHCAANSTIQTSKWFSKEFFLKLRKMYAQLDLDGNGLLSLSELIDYRRVTNTFLQRVFEVQQTYENNELDLRGFCDLVLAMDNKSERAALSYYFRVLDVDGDNLLNSTDLHYFYREISNMYEDYFSEDDAPKAPSFEDIKNEIVDMCGVKRTCEISLKELIASGKGGTIVGMLTDFDCFLDYESHEDEAYEE